MTKEEFLNNLFTRRAAEQYVGLSTIGLQYHLKQGNIQPCKEFGNGPGKVQLFWKDDLDHLISNRIG